MKKILLSILLILITASITNAQWDRARRGNAATVTHSIIYVDDLYEKTSGHTIVINSDVTALGNFTLSLAASEALTVNGKLVVRDTARVEMGLRVKGTSTFGATATPVVIQTTGDIRGLSTAGHRLRMDGLGATFTQTKSLLLENQTAAAAGAQQQSPALIFRGNGWKTDATAASDSVKIAMYLLPVQGTSAPTSRLMVDSKVGSAAWSNLWFSDASNPIYVNGNITSTQQLTAGTRLRTPAITERVLDAGILIEDYNATTPRGILGKANSHGFGTVSPLTNTATFGKKATQMDVLVTRENIAAGTDSSLRAYVLAGNGRYVAKATNADSAILTVDADSARLISNNPWSIAGGITNTGTLLQKGTATFGSTTNHDPIVISPTAKGANAFTGTVTTTGDLTANLTYELPDYSGIHWVTGTRFMRPYIICATDYTAVDLGDGNTNYILETGLGPITYREEQDKTIRSVVNVATGISIDGDNTTNNEGVELLFADGTGSGLGDGWIITGTTGATFLVEFTIADISATDQLLIGFRSCVAFNSSNDYTSYVEHILLGITATDGSIFASSRVPAIAGGAQQTDDSDTNISDATSHTLQVTINASTRVPTAFLDGVAVTLTNCGGARTTATTMAPMITYMHGAEAADPGIVINRISIYR